MGSIVAHLMTFSCNPQDTEIRKAFQRSLTKQGFKFMLGTKVLGARVEGDVVKLTVEPSKGGEQQELDANIVLVSAGMPRHPPHPAFLAAARYATQDPMLCK